MREILSTYSRRLLKSFGVGTMLAAVFFGAAGQWPIIGAFVIGGITAAVCGGILVERLWRSSQLGAVRGKRHMWVGAVLRFLLLLAVFFMAIQVSLPVFIAVVCGFGSFYLLALLHLILGSRR